MAATLDDLLAAFNQLAAVTAGQGGVTAALLQGVLQHTAATATNTGGNTPRPPSPPAALPRGFLRRAGGFLGRAAGVLRTAGRKGGLGALASGGLGKLAAGAGPVGAMAAFAAGLVEAGKAVRNFASEQEGVARRLAQVSPSQAANLAELDTNRVFRDLAQGEATAGSGKGLTDSIDRFEKTVAPLETAFQDLKNTVASGLMDVLSSLLEPLVSLAESVGFVKKPGDDGGGIEMMDDFLWRVSAEQRARDEAAQRRIDVARRRQKRNGGG